MYTPKEMQLNKFVPVSIPKPAQFFARFGVANLPGGSYTGDDFAQMPQSKIDSIYEGERLNNEDLYRQYAQEQARLAAQQNDVISE